MKKYNGENISVRSCFGPVPLSNQLAVLAKKVLGKKGFSNTDLLMHWNDIIGEELAKAVKPEKITYPKGRLEGAILHVHVATGSFAIMVEHQKKIILERANTFMGYCALSDIRIRQDLIEVKTEKPPVYASQLSREQSDFLLQKLQNVQDPELKKKLYDIGKCIFFK